MEKWFAGNVPNLSGKIAVITGATSGLGRETALVLASKGATLVVAGRNAGKLAQLKTELLAAGAEGVNTIGADFSDLRDVCELIHQLSYLRRIDYMVLAAGVLLPQQQKFGRGMAPYDRYEIHMQVNFLAPAFLMRALAGKMANSPYSRIVVVGSSGARMTMRRFNLRTRPLLFHVGAYNASKLAITAYSLWLQRQILGGGRRVQIHVVEPGIVKTNLFEDSSFMGRLIAKGAKVPPTQAIGSILRALFDEGAFAGDYFILRRGGVVRGEAPMRAKDLRLQEIVSRSLNTVMSE